LLEMWPGYQTQMLWTNDGLFFNVDTATKFINSRTIYDEIQEFNKQGYSKAEIKAWYKPANEDAKRFVIITKFNCRQYQVDDLTYDKTPKNHEFEWRSKGKS
jgi:hypothetical protein